MRRFAKPIWDLRFPVSRMLSFSAAYALIIFLGASYGSELTASWLQFQLLESMITLPYLAARNILSLRQKHSLFNFSGALFYTLLMVVFSASVALIHGPTVIALLAAMIAAIKYFFYALVSQAIKRRQVILVEALEKQFPAVFVIALLLLEVREPNFTTVLLLTMLAFTVSTATLLAAHRFRLPENPKSSGNGLKQYISQYVQTIASQADQLLLSFILPANSFATFRTLNLIFRGAFSVSTMQSVYLIPELSAASDNLGKFIRIHNLAFLRTYLAGSAIALVGLGIGSNFLPALVVLKGTMLVGIALAVSYTGPTALFLFGTILVVRRYEELVVSINIVKGITMISFVYFLSVLGGLTPITAATAQVLVLSGSSVAMNVFAHRKIDTL